MTLTGDNGLLTRTVGAKNKTKLAEAQEIANLEYEAGLIDSRVNTNSEVGTIENIKNVLIEKGFTVDYETTSTESITGVRLLDETTPVTNVNLETSGDNTEKILTIDAIMGGAPGTRIYYVQIDNMWHKIEELANKKGIEIKKEGKASLDESNVNNSNQTITFEISGLDESTTVKKVVENGESTTYEDITSQTTFVNGDKIKITAGTSNLSNVTITVSVTNVAENYNVVLTVTKPLAPTATTATPNTTTFNTSYGIIDVIWLDTDNNVVSTPNEPILTSNGESMTPVSWTNSGETWTEDSSAKSTWYSYNAVDTRNTSTNHTDDNNSSMWANAKTANGSYFVWIPRYAYRITYYSSETSITPTGYYDGWGMWKAEDGSLKYALDSGIETVKYEGNKYIVHPAFETNLDNGGWNSELSGFWFAKYEMRGSTASALESKNGTASQVSQSVGLQYTNARNATYGFTGTLDNDDNNTSYMHSHMIKNSEWGAVAYLTHSKYGRNGNEITINDNKNHLRGGGSGTAYLMNINQSTTGNPYGIYDMSGCCTEFTASWASDIADEYISYGAPFASKGGTSTKYATAYSNETSDRYRSLYEVSKIGDAIKEMHQRSI